MAKIEDFIRELAGKAAPKKAPAKVLEGFAGKDAVEAVLAARQGVGRDEQARVAYDKARTLYMPTVNAALAAGFDKAKQVARKISDAEADESWEDWKAAGANLAEAYHLARDVLAAHRKAYDSARKGALPALSSAMGLTEIGGGAVASVLAAADAFAAAGKWREAHERLEQARADAAKVDARAPFVRACRRHQPTIKAAFAITHDGLGKQFEADWEQALKTAASGDYENAANEVEQLARRVDKAKNDPALAKARQAVVKAREENVAAMNSALDGGKVDLKALRTLVANEIGGGKQRALAAQANELGEDPGAKTREPIGDEAGAEQLFKQHDWFALKDMLHHGQISTEAMWDCWRFRQQYVTRLIDTLRKRFPTLIAKTSGSTDLESDIDITFAASTPGDDVKAAGEFNAAVKKDFAQPPGRVFDVNIYPRDYNAISESINPDYNVDPIPDRNIDQPGGAMQKLSRVDQDVATLLKQRRFVDDDAFKALMDSVVASATDAATRQQIRKQFEEGEDIYLMTAFEKVDRIKASLASDPAALDKVPLLKQLDALRDKGGLAALQQAQRLLPQVLDELEAQLPAQVMETTDAMYLEKMATLREEQTRITRLDDAAAEPNAQHDGGCDSVHKGQDHDSWRKAEAERLKAKVKKDQFTNIVFANEAYMSQGAIEHVVAGIQAKDAAKKAAALAGLTPATLMQSCNEQLADFFKDMKASEAEIGAMSDATEQRRATGEAFVHASKYLVRLLDAAQLLADKFAKFDPPVKLEFALLKAARVKAPKELMAKVEAVLLALRKSSTVPAGAKGEVGVDEARALFGVTDIGAFRKLIADFGAELNQKVRANPDFKAELAVDLATERQSFGVPEMPQALKSLLDTARALLEPIGDGAIQAALGEAEGEAEAAQELLDEVGKATKAPQHLAPQIEDAIERAQAVLSTLPRLDVKGVLKRAAVVVQQAPACIDALGDVDGSELHEAYQGDIAKALPALRVQYDRAQEIQAELQGDLKATVLQLNAKLGGLKALLK